MTTATLVTCGRCDALVEEIHRPGGTAAFRVPIPKTPWAPAYIRTVTRQYPPALWLRSVDGRPHEHQRRR